MSAASETMPRQQRHGRSVCIQAARSCSGGGSGGKGKLRAEEDITNVPMLLELYNITYNIELYTILYHIIIYVNVSK